MPAQNLYCSVCGSRFDSEHVLGQCSECGKTSYQNPIPVVVVLLPIAAGLVVIRRNIEPQKGTLTLPGGYIDLGETWQEGGRRELLEETRIDITADEISLYDVQNGLDDTLVVFGLAAKQSPGRLKPFSSKETQEIVLVEEPIELGFPMHTEVVKRFFAEVGHSSGIL